MGCSSGRRGAKEVKAHCFFSTINWKRLEAGLEPPAFVPDVSKPFPLLSQTALSNGISP